ncbi:MAG: DUF1080 domain-containing protein [Arenibacter sp.]|uniref:3-keto-disaccharide hydrolase n=1 Tax=Arenibacter TaxID=178469 RepID=UPI000A3B83FF|nr:MULTISPECIES: DUF1080 domain-containing protein [Arenibacter]MDX1328234.1 DUF1080 domain-containing protein [Arenibacter sp.]
MKKTIALFVFALAMTSCKMNQKSKPESVEATAETEDWIYLFDGTSTEGWRAYNGDSLPPGWTIKDSTLTFDTELGMEQDYTGGTDIIYGAEEFDNFELYVEWKLPKGGNSGIFYHLKENIPNEGPATISPEYQLIDDENYAAIHDLTEYNLSLGNTENPAELQPLQQTASDYAMYPADPDKKVLNPVGEWNTTKIVFTPEKVEHWLNGQKVLSFVPWSEDWYERKNTGKWKDAENYGRFKSGYIGFQDHSSPIWFRNVKIRKL